MREREGFVIWITGLPFSGKKDLAGQLQARLEALGFKAQVLEGGQIRRRFEDRLGFTRDQIGHNLRRISFEAQLLAEAGVVAIVAAISPFREHRDAARRTLGRFIEVYCRCPMEVLEARDTIGFYRRARAGELENVAGVSFPYEEPTDAEAVYDSDRMTIGEGVRAVLEAAERAGYLVRAEHSILTQREEEALRRRLRDSWE